jgi:hypothetical protein
MTILKDIKSKIYSAKSKAILSANRLMIKLYFEIDKEIVKIKNPKLCSISSKDLLGDSGWIIYQKGENVK